MMPSHTVVRVLTPPGIGAVATVEVAGPRAWECVRGLFRPAHGTLPMAAPLHRVWFGHCGVGTGDEVILAVTAVEPSQPTTRIEVHCHGGVRGVAWVVEQFVNAGCLLGTALPASAPTAFDQLQLAPTLRTANILLDQLNGAFAQVVRKILQQLETSPEAAAESLDELARAAAVGQHLVAPWKVVIAGAPNAGKSSLVNALAGYQRAIVSPTPGTTRDTVSVPMAFEGWPVELTDTAGLRVAEGLEADGIDRAYRAIHEADWVLWVTDACEPVGVPEVLARTQHLVVWNKIDLGDTAGAMACPAGACAISARTGSGIPQLLEAIVQRLVPHAPPPGAAVPFTPELAARVLAAKQALSRGDSALALYFLRDCANRV